MKIYYIDFNKGICIDVTKKMKEIVTDEKLIKLGITSIAIFEIMNGNVTHAYTGISDAVKPLVDVLVDAAEPISYGFMVKGFIQWMSGAEHEGKKSIKSSVAGYLGIQFIPQIFKIIRNIKL